MKDIIEWQRFWCKSKNDIKLDMDGFLSDPTIKKFNAETNIFDFETISSIQCLILLGEAGSGKSTTIESEYKKQTRNNIDDIILYKNLNEYGDENRFINEVFESNEINDWILSDKNLIIFLDSYDECLLEIKKLPLIIKKQLERFRKISSRLQLRIICRSGNWNNSLSDYLTDFFGKDNIALFEIAPLRSIDIELVAKHNELNEASFIKEIIRKQVQPFAMNPLTLFFLISEYKSNQQIYPTLERIYYEGCKILCKEQNVDRLDTSGNYNLATERKIAIASRIAALMVFCNKSIIDIRSTSNIDSRSLILSDILEGDELTDDYSFSFTQKDVIETVTQTSLFSFCGNSSFSFYHWAYAEFLAAKFIVNQEFEVKQILSLITISSDDEGKTVEQVKGTAAWLSILSPKLLKNTINNDPLTLLNGDISGISNESKKELVQSILDKLDATTITDSDWSLNLQYHKIMHPTLSEQIKPYIENTSKYFLSRRVAIDIAETCELIELNDVLLDVVNNRNEKLYIRKEAMHALSIIADDSFKIQLKQYAIDPNEEDIDDELKGTALLATWPNIITTKDVFKALTPIKKSDLSGAYYFFINYKFSEDIALEYLEDALFWVQGNQANSDDMFDSFENLKTKIIYYCWQNYTTLPNQKLFAEVILQLMQNYSSIYTVPQTYSKKLDNLVISKNVKQQIVKHIVKIDKFKNNEQLYLLINNDLVSLLDDFQFILEEFKKELISKIKVKWAIILGMFEYSSSDRIDQIIELTPQSEELKQVFGMQLEPIEIGSEKAQQIKQQYEEQKKWQQNLYKIKDTESNPKIDVQQRILDCITNYDNTKRGDYFVQLFMDLTLTETSRVYGDRLNSNITQLIAWNNTPLEIRLKIIELSEGYIKDNNDCFDEWFGTDKFHFIATTGYKSLILLKKHNPDFVRNLSPEILDSWIYIIINYPESSGISGTDKTYLDLIKDAYSKIPDKIVDIVSKKIDIENEREDGYLPILRKIEHLLDVQMQNALLEKVKDKNIKDKPKSLIFELLLDKNNEESKLLAKKYIKENNDELRVLVAVQFSKFCDNNDWKVIIECVNKDPEFGKKFFLKYADDYDMRAKPIWKRIDDNELALLYIKLCDFFPKEEDPQIEGAHFIGDREEVGRFRDTILNQLASKGTEESIRALEFINKELSTNEDVKFSLVSAKTNFRRTNWKPLSPQEFLRLSQNGKMRVILNNTDLQNIIIESLERLEQRLQGESPLSQSLWNITKSGSESVYKHKEEEHLSNIIRDHLFYDIQKYGVSTYREVQFRCKNLNKTSDSRKGENVDLQISCTNRDTNENYTVIVEVKGSWNKETPKNMHSQLVERYLNSGDYTHGLYLIGWYVCAAEEINETECLYIDDARIKYREQATEISKETGKTIKSIVLDCRLRN
ncbi:MAG: hypothetical protein WC542_08575 [Paludibacter sp.]